MAASRKEADTHTQVNLSRECANYPDYPGQLSGLTHFKIQDRHL